MMPSQTPSSAELRERAWQRLVAMVPLAIKIATGRKTKLEARIEAGKKLSSQAQKELDEIRTRLNRIERARVSALLSRMDLDKLQAALRQVAEGARR